MAAHKGERGGGGRRPIIIIIFYPNITNDNYVKIFYSSKLARALDPNNNRMTNFL